MFCYCFFVYLKGQKVATNPTAESPRNQKRNQEEGQGQNQVINIVDEDPAAETAGHVQGHTQDIDPSQEVKIWIEKVLEACDQ